MSNDRTGMAERAYIDLHFAQSEIKMLGNRVSLLRALDHVRQAEASLMIVTEGNDFPPEDEHPTNPPAAKSIPWKDGSGSEVMAKRRRRSQQHFTPSFKE